MDAWLSYSFRCFWMALLTGSAISTYGQSPVQIDALNAKAWELIFSEPMQAREYSMQAKEWSEKLNYLPGLGDCYSTLGYLYCSEGAYTDGYKYYDESLRARRASGDSTKVANVFINLSIFKNDEGHYDEARSNATRAINILENLLHKASIGSKSSQKIAFSLGQALLNLSNIYSDFQDNVLALEYAKKGYSILCRGPNDQYLALAMKTLANRYYTAWEPKGSHQDYADSATLYYRQALEFFIQNKAESVNAPMEAADLYYNGAQVDFDLGNFRDAWDKLEKAEKMYQQMEAGSEWSSGLFYVWLAKGKWYANFKKDPTTALTFFTQAKQLNQQDAIDAGAQLDLLNLLSETFAQLGKRDSAFFYQKQALSLSRSNFNERLSQFQKGERQDWKQKLNSEIAASALVKERQRFLNLTIVALILLIALLSVVGWVIVRALRLRAQVANQKIREMVDRLDARYLEGIESEREQIAGILHDDLGGQSVANTWMIEALSEKLPAGSDQQHLAKKILQNSQHLSEAIRAFSHRLSALYVQRTGLVPTLEDLCQQISQSGRIKATLHVQPWKNQLDVGQEIQLLRILQELMTNTIKHAKAKAIQVELKTQDGYFILYYADDGIGFDISQAMEKNNGLGLQHVQKRVAVLQGKMEVGSQPGMWLSISFPF